MALQIQGNSGTVAEVNSLFRGARVTIYPADILSWNSVGPTTGLLTGLAANAPIFSMRYTGTGVLIVRRITVAAVTRTAFTTAQGLQYQLFFARSFTVFDSGGTAVVQTGNQNKHRTSLPSPTAVEMTISNATALTPGTRTLDTVAMRTACGASTGVGTVMTQAFLLSHDTGDYPLVLAPNEGLVIQSAQAMGAAGVVNALVNVEYAEAESY